MRDSKPMTVTVYIKFIYKNSNCNYSYYDSKQNKTNDLNNFLPW